MNYVPMWTRFFRINNYQYSYTGTCSGKNKNLYEGKGNSSMSICSPILSSISLAFKIKFKWFPIIVYICIYYISIDMTSVDP